MKSASMTLALLLLASALAPGVARAQRQRQVGDSPAPVPAAQQQAQEAGDAAPKVRTAAPPAPPKVVKAKYMGGFAGMRKKQEGMLSFDDRNRRLVFRDKDEKELFSIAYDAVTVAFADTETRRAMGNGTQSVVLGTAGVFGMPALLFKKKFQYLTVEFQDPDSYLKGTTQFKLADRATVESVAYALAQKAGLARQGEVYVRRRGATTTPASADKTTNP